MKDEAPPNPRKPVCYPDNTVLTLVQVAAGLQISRRSAERLRLPVVWLGPQLRRYVWRHVVAFVEGLSE